MINLNSTISFRFVHSKKVLNVYALYIRFFIEENEKFLHKHTLVFNQFRLYKRYSKS